MVEHQLRLRPMLICRRGLGGLVCYAGVRMKLFVSLRFIFLAALKASATRQDGGWFFGWFALYVAGVVLQ